MLTSLAIGLDGTLAHTGAPATWHDLWGAWNLDPLVLGLTAAAVAVAIRAARASGRAPIRRRATWFALGAIVAGLSIVSPLDALAGSLASAHMVQHVVLVLVAAPLLALGSPLTVAAAAATPALRARLRPLGRRAHGGRVVGLHRHPIAVWVAAVVTLWVWHAAGPYAAAVEHEAVHALQHATFLAATAAFWAVALRRPSRSGPASGMPVLLVFAFAVQGVFLSVLLTFAEEPWYARVYGDTTTAFGLSPLEDQRLAGAIMWVPASVVQTAIGLALFVRWLRSTEDDIVTDPLADRLPAGGAG